MANTRKILNYKLTSAEKLARLVPSPQRQLKKDGCCVSVPKNFRPRSSTEKLFLFKPMPFIGKKEVVVKGNFNDDVCRLNSLAFSHGVEMTPWETKKDDLATLVDVSGSSYIEKGCRFVAVDLDGAESETNYKAGTVVLQLLGELIRPLVTKVPFGGFNFPIAGFTVGGCGKKRSNTCLLFSVLRMGKRTCITISKETLIDVGKTDDLRLITVRELDPSEY